MTQERIISLLEDWQDARETLQRGEGGRRTDDSALHWHELYMPNVWHEGGFARLERALIFLRAARPDLYWHVAERYVRSTLRTRRVVVRAGRVELPPGVYLWRGGDSGRPSSRRTHAVDREERRVFVCRPGVDERMVNLGVRALALIYPRVTRTEAVA